MSSHLLASTFPTPSSVHDLYYNHPSHTITNTTATTTSNDSSADDSGIYGDALAFSRHSTFQFGYQTTVPASHLRVQYPKSKVSPHRSAPSARHDSAISDAIVNTRGWQTQMYQASYNSVGGGLVADHSKGIKRARSHQRTSSASTADSTVASTGPASPYTQNSSYPHIANTDQEPDATDFYTDRALYTKNLPTPSHTPIENGFVNAYMPKQTAHMPNAHLAMKGFGIDHHNAEDFAPDFAPSRQSMSSYGNDSPATPQSGIGEDAKNYSLTQNDYRQSNPNVQLFRTDSQAYQDELFNPNTVYTSAPKQSNAFLSPHRNLVTERLQTADLARSTSPSSLSRERSPFRDGSPLALSQDWHPQGGPVGTAANVRRQQKVAAAEAEYAQHRAPLRREPTKTISPKDALLDYNDTDQSSLFQDNIPAGYERHAGGTDQWPTNNYFGQPSQAFRNVQSTAQQNMNFRNATSADDGYSGTAFDFTTLPPGLPDQIQNHSFQTNYTAVAAAKMSNKYEQTTPAFPATIPSMETSISDAGMPASSQESVPEFTSAPQRPTDTRANTGTYTCTYHGCTQRFDSPLNLQKHKREFHRSQQQREDTSPSASGSASPQSNDDSPAPSSTAGMTSAAILARNSQAGPHKCTRINPSTNKPCNTIFSRPYDLTRHEDTIHNNRKHKVRCPMCREEKTFSRNDALTRHMRVVHPEVETFGKRRRGD